MWPTLAPLALPFTFHLSSQTGQTGAGKTFTMQGPSADSEEGPSDMQCDPSDASSGMIPRTLAYLFSRLEDDKAAAVAEGAIFEFTCRHAAAALYAPQRPRGRRVPGGRPRPRSIACSPPALQSPPEPLHSRLPRAP